MSEDAQPGASPDTQAGQDLSLARTTRLSDRVAGHLADQARVTAQGAKARRMTSTDGEPGMADFTPLRDLFSELREEARKVKARERIAHALRQAADALDPPG
jgi:uncharacterized small protein (DUF1192 family)